MPAIVNETLATDRFTAFMLAAFVAVALLLAAVGIFGVFSLNLPGRRSSRRRAAHGVTLDRD